MAAIEGIVTVELDVQLSALGRSLQTMIANHKAELRLPGPPVAEGGTGSGNQLTAPAFEYFRDGERLREWMDDTSPAWGKVYLRDTSGEGAASVRRCALVVPVADALPQLRRQEVADDIFREVDRWRSIVLDWLETAFGQALGVEIPSRSGAAISPWLWSPDGRERVEHYNKEPLTANGAGLFENALDAPLLQQVVHLAGDLTRPELAWLLTRDARHQHRAEEYRRAVLDAGTAAELALCEVLQQHGLPPSGKETLGRLINEAIRATPLPIPQDAQSGLVQLRNDATHRAAAPMEQTAARALEISGQFVEAAWPRGRLLAAATAART